MTTNPSPPQGSEEFDCDEIEKELSQITPWPWKWEAEDHSLCSLGNVENSLLHHVMSAWRCDSCGHSDKQCLWPNKIDSEFISQSPQRLAAAVKRVRELEAQLKENEKKALERCWQAVNAKIRLGDLPGNGLDESAYRNGIIVSANTIMGLICDFNKSSDKE